VKADNEPQLQMVNLDSAYLLEPDLPWVDEEVLGQTHGKGYETAIHRIETELGVILWDEVGKGGKTGNSINVQLQGSGTVQSTSLTIRN